MAKPNKEQLATRAVEEACGGLCPGSSAPFPKHDCSGQEAGSGNGEVEIAAGDRYSGLTSTAECRGRLVVASAGTTNGPRSRKICGVFEVAVLGTT
jgi:hypothetical protein